MHRLSEAQRRELYGYWRDVGEMSPLVTERLTRGGPFRAVAPFVENLLFGRTTEALRTARYVFCAHRYGQLIAGLPRSELAFLGTRRAQLRFAREQGIAAASVFAERRAIASNFPECNRPELLDRAFDRLVRALSGEPGRFLIVKTDTNPINRLLILAARKAGMHTVVIQHGIFQRASPGFIMDGWCADFTLTYDAYQLEVLAEKGIERDRMRVLGFHTQPVDGRLATPPPGPNRRICLMGQNWTSLDNELGRRYAEIVLEAHATLVRAGHDVTFKPHPRELEEPYLREFPKRFDGTVAEALREFDVAISLTSTTLLETTLSGRVAIQLHEDLFDADRFDEAGYAHCLPVERMEELPELCENAAPIVNPDLDVLTPAQLSQRFERSLESLAAQVAKPLAAR